MQTNPPSSSLPGELRSLLLGRTREVANTGESPARVERWVSGTGDVLFLKSALVEGPLAIADEIARLEWMGSNGIPVPRIVATLVDGDTVHLLTEALPGADASVRLADRTDPSVVAALGAALRQLHATPVGHCPFVHPLATRVQEAARRVAAGFIDSSEFDDSRGTRNPSELLDRLRASHERLEEGQRRGDRPPEGRVFTHGDYCLPNVILHRRATDAPDGNLLSGFIDVGRAGVADPWQDLALAARSITRNLGATWVPMFFAEYGLDRIDGERIELYTLLDEFF